MTLTMDDVIDEKVIEACEIEGACSGGLTWATEKPRTYQELRNHSFEWYKWLTSHKNYSATLELLAKDAAVYVRRCVAQNAGTPVATLELLAKDADVDVRWKAARSLRNIYPNISTLEHLSA